MEGIIEKFTIEIKGSDIHITGRDGQRPHFTAGEALMLLDILKNEEEKLKRMSGEASPIPTKLNL
jgi:hypothetical protein